MAQEYIYKHYDSKDGLANSSVYQMLQDKDGFIWFATGGGLSRFDGKNFKNFSTLDGLPVNMIVRMFEDSRGRIWLMPYKNEICYYYEGKIYNQQNDSVLRKIKLEDFVRSVAENKSKELLLTDSKKIYHIDAQNHVRLIEQTMSASSMITQLTAREWGNFYVCFNRRLFSTDTKTFRYLQDIPEGEALHNLVIHDKVTCWMSLNTLCVKSAYYKKSYKQFIGSVNTMYLLSDSVLCLNTTEGSILYNFVQQKIEKQLLQNGNVSHFMVDKEGGYWFSTLNNGVFRLGSPAFKIIAGQTATGQKLGVYHLEKFNNDIWAACDMGHLLQITNNSATIVPLTIGKEGFSSLVYSITAKEDRLATLCGDYVFVKEPDNTFKHHLGLGSGKGLAWKNDRELLVASSHGLYTMQINEPTQNVVHKIGRIISLYYRNDSAWFSTFDGLYLMKPDANIIYLGQDNPLLRAPVRSIREGLDGTIWLATKGSGLLGLQNNKIAWHFGKYNGLNSDDVRCIGIDSGFIWAGTENDLNKIPFQTPSVITRYSYSDELNSDITSILVDKNIIYAGTSDGVTWFDKRDTFNSSMCNLKLLSITVNEEEKKLQNDYFLPYKNNSVRFDYAGISMKSAGNIVYHYRLNGLDTNWKTTTQTSLDLISLPPGEYRFEMYAVNKFGVKSAPYRVNIVVQNPFWKTGWFMSGAILLTALTAWFISTRHNRVIIRKEKLRRQAQQQLLDLEQKALRAQMNPHFIFNCLYSIQSFILDKEPEKANKYLTQFASLIRQTLENSLQSFISLADEIKYLGTYLQLEQMRSESKFEYRIETEAGLSTDA
ncbi:MAG: histidine kinase, partial [Chitinophagaceae bacterium]|nr:histidine kinase [Chitinophagaceae bacterium]